ncbi:MAG: DUF4286 family protein [Geminicoccaceae bacterium]|nr:hypothetical protein [Geminicoccaceae bacterium]MDW8125396.1 DUF4286 family protein [Geminicoccaceae bacterium]MDW8342436.1 DUF4286 family protein [Geminicoccaceae bacterium]
MSLFGEGVIAIWSDIREDGLETFYAWHDNEHVPERVGIPGFIRGRRYVAVEGSPRFYMQYETVSPQVQVGQDYLNRLNDPTEWTRRTLAYFENTTRSLTRKVFSQAKGDGAELVAAGVDAPREALAALRRVLVTGFLPELYLDHAVQGVHWLETDRSASTIETAEKRGRQVGVCDAVVLIETTRPGPARAARGRLEELLGAAEGVRLVVPPGHWRLEHQKVKLWL